MYRRRTRVIYTLIDAMEIRTDEKSLRKLSNFTGCDVVVVTSDVPNKIKILIGNDYLLAFEGDYAVRDATGRLSVVCKYVFDTNYEEIYGIMYK